MPRASYQPDSEDFLVKQCNLMETLRSERFKAALYITKLNETATCYALRRADQFAEASNAQTLWVQAEDYLDLGCALPALSGTQQSAHQHR